MIKNLLFAATAFVAISMSANAQETVFSENFDNFEEWPDSEWVQYNEDGNTVSPDLGAVSAAFTDDAPWALIALNNDPDNVFIASASWFTTPGQADRWIVSPVIDLSSYTSGSVTLTFNSQSGGNENFPDGYNLFVSTTGTDIADFGTTPIYQEEAAVSGEWGTQTVDLSDYIGETIHLAWQHNSTDMVMIFIDNVNVVHDTDSSTENFAKLGLNVFPNPVSDMVNITSPEANIEAVTITDLNGRTVKSINFNNVAETAVDASDLASGIYLMNITANGTVATHKIVKK